MAIVKDDKILASEYNLIDYYNFKDVKTNSPNAWGEAFGTFVFGLPPYGSIKLANSTSWNGGGNEVWYQVKYSDEETWFPYVEIEPNETTYVNEHSGRWRDMRLKHRAVNALTPNWIKTDISIKNTVTADKFIRVFDSTFQNFLTANTNVITAATAIKQGYGESDV